MTTPLDWVQINNPEYQLWNADLLQYGRQYSQNLNDILNSTLISAAGTASNGQPLGLRLLPSVNGTIKLWGQLEYIGPPVNPLLQGDLTLEFSPSLIGGELTQMFFQPVPFGSLSPSENGTLNIVPGTGNPDNWVLRLYGNGVSPLNTNDLIWVNYDILPAQVS
jgi:hypothetical protein